MSFVNTAIIEIFIIKFAINTSKSFYQKSCNAILVKVFHPPNSLGNLHGKIKQTQISTNKGKP